MNSHCCIAQATTMAQLQNVLLWPCLLSPWQVMCAMPAGVGLVDTAPIACSRDFITHRPWCERPHVESLENFTFSQRVIDSRQVPEHTSCGTDSGSPYPLSRIAGFASDHVVGSSGSASGHHISLPCTLAALIHSCVPCYSVVMLMGCTPG